VRTVPIVWVWLGCTNQFDPPLPAERDCEVRQAFYPDEDGDGLGEPTAVRIGCEPPEGYVTELGHTGDTGAP